MSYFYDALSTHDERVLSTKRGIADGQQVWECLCLLVALRVWSSWWLPRRSAIAIRSDNKTAIAMAATLKGTGSCNIIARELAIIYAHSSFQPKVVEHLPGLANVAADALSRLHEPGAHYAIPDELLGLSPVPVPVRDERYYRTLATE